MKIRSNIVTQADVEAAFYQARNGDGADIYLDGIRSFQPRRHTHGVEFWAKATNGRYATGHRPVGSYPLDDQPRAASWNAYGHVIARLYQLDPDAEIGHYNDVTDFIAQCEQNHRNQTKRTPRNIDFLEKVK